ASVDFGFQLYIRYLLYSANSRFVLRPTGHSCQVPVHLEVAKFHVTAGGSGLHVQALVHTELLAASARQSTRLNLPGTTLEAVLIRLAIGRGGKFVLAARSWRQLRGWQLRWTAAAQQGVQLRAVGELQAVAARAVEARSLLDRATVGRLLVNVGIGSGCCRIAVDSSSDGSRAVSPVQNATSPVRFSFIRLTAASELSELTASLPPADRAGPCGAAPVVQRTAVPWRRAARKRPTGFDDERVGSRFWWRIISSLLLLLRPASAHIGDDEVKLVNLLFEHTRLQNRLTRPVADLNQTVHGGLWTGDAREATNKSDCSGDPEKPTSEFKRLQQQLSMAKASAAQSCIASLVDWALAVGGCLSSQLNAGLNKDELATLCFDGISLSPSVRYDSNADRVVAFDEPDSRGTEEVLPAGSQQQEQQLKPVNERIVAVLRGVAQDWKQPIAPISREPTLVGQSGFKPPSPSACAPSHEAGVRLLL
uniref:Protein kinase domain-containing protein n=1 Tax=Macrostomum lignano TaxID=282301 RepID=A0A1I8FIM4_9PLAT